jgi:hypothetical protein
VAQAGWPCNHTGQAFALITLIYARHYSWLDYAAWSSVDVWIWVADASAVLAAVLHAR